MANGGSTTITGIVILNSTGAKTDAASIHATRNDTKNLEFDADAAETSVLSKTLIKTFPTSL